MQCGAVDSGAAARLSGCSQGLPSESRPWPRLQHGGLQWRCQCLHMLASVSPSCHCFACSPSGSPCHCSHFIQVKNAMCELRLLSRQLHKTQSKEATQHYMQPCDLEWVCPSCKVLACQLCAGGRLQQFSLEGCPTSRQRNWIWNWPLKGMVDSHRAHIDLLLLHVVLCLQDTPHVL